MRRQRQYKVGNPTDVSIKENYVLELSLGETISSGRTLASKSAPVNNLNSNDLNKTKK